MEGTGAAPYLSVVIPIFNEEGNITPLLAQLFSVLRSLPHSFEVLAIDDGSEDASFTELEIGTRQYPELKVVRFRRNYGQTAALAAGIDFSRGEVVVSLDGDLQNDPSDIPALLTRLAEGYDVVSGWRKARQDARFRRALASRIANRMVSWISGVHLNDHGCTLKAYRRHIIKDMRLYGEMHRLIAIHAHRLGARVTELPVQHHPRVRGQSKYGLERVAKIVLDLMVVTFLDRCFVKPMYVFGGIGLVFMTGAILSLVATIWSSLTEGVSMGPMLALLFVLFFASGTISLLMGLLAEMIVRTYFESTHRPVYTVRDSVNL